MSRFPNGRVRALVLVAAGVLAAALPGLARAGSGAVGVQGTASDFFDRTADDYDGGPGLNVFGTYRWNRSFDLRADVGVRFLEGNQTLQRGDGAAPDLGARDGERTESARVLPFSLGLAYRFEQWSKDRFWLPYVAAGVGFYDLQLTYVGGEGGDDADESGDERKQNLYEFGCHGRLGVHLYRTSGLFVNLESSVHGIQTDERWLPMWDVAIGVGTLLPRD